MTEIQEPEVYYKCVPHFTLWALDYWYIRSSGGYFSHSISGLLFNHFSVFSKVSLAPEHVIHNHIPGLYSCLMHNQELVKTQTCYSFVG